MESISPITLRKALDALALPARAQGPDRECEREHDHADEPALGPHHDAWLTGSAAWMGLGVTLLAVALGAAWAMSARG